MLNKNDAIELTIDDLTVEGAGVGRHEGMAVFVPRALPGEAVTAHIVKTAKNYAAAKLSALHRSSPERVAPVCPAFERCGGCTLQHLSYAGQLEYKRRYVRECFRRIGGIDIELPEIVPSDAVQAYRNKAAFPVQHTDGGVNAGFFAPRSHHVVPADCAIQRPALNAVKDAVVQWARENGISAYDEETGRGTLRHIVARQASDGPVMAGVVVCEGVDEASLVEALKRVPGIRSVVLNLNRDKGNAILGAKSRVLWGDEALTERYEDLFFRAGLTSFLQVNHPQSERLYGIALEYAAISKKDTVFDLFCGIGTLSLLAAKRAKAVVGIEYVEDAVENARENAKLNGIDNAQFLAGDAGAMLAEAVHTAAKPDVVLLDPPRKGCEKRLLEELAAMEPKRIIYVSCDAATLARDAAVLCTGGYEVKAVKAVDMFPQTTHVECVVLMSRVKD